MRRLHFQLLEVMVAIFILLISVGPAMHIFNNIFVQQQNVLRTNERDYLVNQIHVYLLQQLYRRTIGFDEILVRKMTPLQDSELNAALQNIQYRAFYYFDTVEQKKSKAKSEKPDMYLVTLVILLQDLDMKSKKNDSETNETLYNYQIYIDAPQGEANLNSPIDEDKILSNPESGVSSLPSDGISPNGEAASKTGAQ